MSALPQEEGTLHEGGPGSGAPESAHVPEPVEVRRNAAVAAVLGVASAAVAIAYLWRIGGGGTAFDVLLCLVMTGFAVVFLHSLLDSRTPLLVADEMGVRLRLGSQWRGLPWEAIDRVVVHPRKGLLRDGRVLISLVHVTRTIEGLDGRARRHAMLNRKLYGAALAVPLGLATRLEGSDQEGLSDRFQSLAQDRAEVLTVLDTPETPVIPVEETAAESEQTPAARERRRWGRRRPTEETPVDETEAEDVEPEFGEPVALAETDLLDRTPADVSPLRQTFTQDAVRTVIEAVSPVERSDSRVRAIAKLGDPVGPLVIDDYVPEPAYDPVIGPELAASRTRVGLSVDELAERTRIRPHVIESIEVDDFTPCGGDFYARGHIRTLARVLGKDPVPMLEVFDARYAKAPINARKVFEAELATGMGGQMRRPYGGASWTGLIATVLVLVLVWAMVRLFAGDSSVSFEDAPPVLNGSAGLDNGNSFDRPVPPAGPKPRPTTITALNGGAHVEVRDGDGNLVWEGDLVIGQVQTVKVAPPVTVTSDNGAAVTVKLGKADLGALGTAEEPTTRTYQADEGRGTAG
jgi:cytoskeletal protein RodZ